MHLEHTLISYSPQDWFIANKGAYTYGSIWWMCI